MLTTDCNFNENGIKNISKTFKAKQVKSNLQESDYMYLEENDLRHNSEFKLKDNLMFKFDHFSLNKKASYLRNSLDTVNIKPTTNNLTTAKLNSKELNDNLKLTKINDNLKPKIQKYL